MKKNYLIFLLMLGLLAPWSARAQSPDDVLTAGADDGFLADGTTIAWLLGEIMVEFYEDGFSLDQGFQLTSLQAVGAPEPGGTPAFQVTAYPNPTPDQVQVATTDQQAFDLSLYDLQGRLLYTAADCLFRHDLALGNHPSGPYFLTITRQGRLLKTFILQKIH